MSPERRPATPRLGPLAPGTLGRRLVTRVVSLLAATSVALTALSLLTLGRAMENQVDRQVTTAAARVWSSLPAIDPGGGPDQVVMVIGEAGPEATLFGSDTTTHQLTDEEILRELVAVPQDGRPHTVMLPELGAYRVLASNSPAGGQPADQRVRLVVGETMGPTFSFLGTFALIMGAVTALAVLVAVGLVRSLIRTSMLPLSTLAGRAEDVAAMELVKGDVEFDVDGDDPSPNSEVGRMAAAFNKMLRHVSHALSARQASETKVRRFVADASHELRNPLAAIRGYAEITRRDRASLPPDAAFALDRIDAESARMQRLVEDLLTLARLDTAPELDLDSADLRDVLLTSVSDARAAGPEHRWTLDLPRDPVVAVLDEHRVQQVLINILTNARVHTPAGTHVCATLRRDGEFAEVDIANDGPSIPIEKQSAIFERFARIDPSRQRQGPGSTGLGLAIVRAVVEAHDGTVTLDSEEGRTAFTIRLPLAGPAQADTRDRQV